MTGQAKGERRVVGWRAGPLTLLLAGALCVLAGCGAAATSRDGYSVPAGWHDIGIPTSNGIVAYAASPDVPGLIFACAGDQTRYVSGAPMGAAHLWRTRDFGAHWELLPRPAGLFAGCSITLPPGGNGLVFVSSALDGTGSAGATIAVSEDAGTTWQTILTTSGGGPAPIELLDRVLAGSVVRGGRLYATGSPVPVKLPGGLGQRFAVSADEGRTWTALEPQADPLSGQGYVVQSIAPDERQDGAWFRLWGLTQGAPLTPGASGQPPTAVLQHSADDGQTWQTLGPLPLGGGYAVAGEGAAVLATTPLRPGRLCAGFDLAASEVTTSGAAQARAPREPVGQVLPLGLRVGVPYQPPHATALLASDDAGQTWTGGIVAQHPHNTFAPVAPEVSINERGDCFTADAAMTSGPGVTSALIYDTTIWELARGQSQAGSLTRMHGLVVRQALAVPVSAAAGPRLVAVVAVPGPAIIYCGPNSCPPETPHPPHLIWMPMPT